MNEKVSLNHPLGERIRIRKEIPSMTEETARILSKHHEVELDDKVIKLALERNVRTLELDLLLYTAKKAGIEKLDAKTFKKLLKKIREEGIS